MARQPVDLRRAEAEAQHVVEVKIVQLIRADERLRLLGDLAVFVRRQQLGTDRRVENVEQHGAQGLVFRRVGGIAHDMAHERFRHVGVHAVHAHVVAVVGRPAEGQLAQIARADDEPARAVGEVHELERAHAGLAVFIRHVERGFVLPDVGKVAVDGARDRDLLKCHAQLLAEDLGVRARAVRRAEARHRHGQHVLCRAAEPLHRVHGHEQRKAAVQSAGDADDGGLGVRVGNALGQPVGLHGEDELAALGAGGIVGRDERRRRDGPRERHLPQRQVEHDRLVSRALGLERRAAAALADHAAEVELRVGAARAEGLRFCQQRAVFADEVVRGKDHVGRGFSVAGVGVEIRAQQPRRLLAHERAAVVGLADRLVAGREVCDHGRARERVVRARRQRSPQILAHLGREAKLRHLRAAKQQLRAERHLLPGKAQRAHAGGCGVELPLFVKLAVVRQVRFRHQTQQLPVADDGGAVIELAVHRDRQAHECDKVEPRARLQHGGEPFGCGALERLLEKQVAARVAGQPQFGEHSQLRAVQRRAPHGGDGLLCVERAVGHAQRRRDRAGFEKTVDHDVITLSKSKTRSAKRSGRRGKFARAADRN